MALHIHRGVELFMALIVQMDPSGRLVLPKSVRDALHVSGPAAFAVEVIGGHLELTPAAVEGESGLVDKGGMRVLARTGASVDAAAAVRADRHARR
jgi:bifunctional DNA-binding transcriptional regulator/antitoxin component of YhaV-PrlF toxin-antitoxin module